MDSLCLADQLKAARDEEAVKALLKAVKKPA